MPGDIRTLSPNKTGGGRDGALRRPRPRPGGRPERGGRPVGRGSVPSPDAALGDGDSAARCPFPGQCRCTPAGETHHYRLDKDRRPRNTAPGNVSLII